MPRRTKKYDDRGPRYQNHLDYETKQWKFVRGTIWVEQALIETMQAKELTVREMLLCAMCNNTSRPLTCSNSWIAKRIGVTTATARRMVWELIKEKWLKRKQTRTGRGLTFNRKKMLKIVAEENDDRRDLGIPVPCFMISFPNLTGSQMLVWAYIYSFYLPGKGGKRKRCFVSNAKIALEIGSNRASTANEIIRVLKKRGLIKVGWDKDKRRILQFEDRSDLWDYEC